MIIFGKKRRIVGFIILRTLRFGEYETRVFFLSWKVSIPLIIIVIQCIEIDSFSSKNAYIYHLGIWT
jgi:hypothetical protein